VCSPVDHKNSSISEQAVAQQIGRSLGRTCEGHYPVDHGIPQLFAPVDPTMSDRDVTEMVKAFYEETPFPNYDDIDSRETLVMKARQGRFAAALDAQLPEGAIVLEAGCGTRR
jgi:hypothetical protein